MSIEVKFILVVSTCQTQHQEARITQWTTLGDVIDIIEPVFGIITRLQGRRDGTEFVDVNDKDAWIRHMSFWTELPMEAEFPPMYLEATVADPIPELFTGTATASDAAILLDKVFNRDNGRRHDEGPFVWTQREMIGRGAKGLVYKGVKDDGELIAVKAFDVSNERRQETCALELSLLNMLDHPNIIHILGHYDNPREPVVFILLEYMEGGSLRHRIEMTNKQHFNAKEAMQPCLPADIVRDFTRQIVDGVVYLHSQCVVHRDLKAANVLISKDEVLKLCDFDVSKELPFDRRSAACETVIGSPYWFAPELCRGDAPYGLKVDVWAIGCVIIEMVTGGLPWQEFKCLVAAVAIIGDTTGPPPHLPNDLPEPLSSFADRCFQLNPKQRASAAELAQHPYLQF